MNWSHCYGFSDIIVVARLSQSPYKSQKSAWPPPHHSKIQTTKDASSGVEFTNMGRNAKYPPFMVSTIAPHTHTHILSRSLPLSLPRSPRLRNLSPPDEKNEIHHQPRVATLRLQNFFKFSLQNFRITLWKRSIGKNIPHKPPDYSNDISLSLDLKSGSTVSIFT